MRPRDPVAYADVTKSGKELGVVAIAGGSGFYETAGIARVPVDKFVRDVRGLRKADR